MNEFKVEIGQTKSDADNKWPSQKIKRPVEL